MVNTSRISTLPKNKQNNNNNNSKSNIKLTFVSVLYVFAFKSQLDHQNACKDTLWASCLSITC